MRRYAITGICYGISIGLSVCQYVCLCIKMAKRFIKILLPPDSPIILVFCHRGSLFNSDSITPNRGAEYKGGGLENWVVFE